MKIRNFFAAAGVSALATVFFTGAAEAHCVWRTAHVHPHGWTKACVQHTWSHQRTYRPDGGGRYYTGSIYGYPTPGVAPYTGSAYTLRRW